MSKIGDFFKDMASIPGTAISGILQGVGGVVKDVGSSGILNSDAAKILATGYSGGAGAGGAGGILDQLKSGVGKGGSSSATNGISDMWSKIPTPLKWAAGAGLAWWGLKKMGVIGNKGGRR
jgi:hypothetical protein